MGIVLCEHAPVIRAVRIMACRAVSVLNRAVTVLIDFKKRLHVLYSAGLCVDLFVMAPQTQIHLGLWKEFGNLGHMGLVTIQTCPALGCRCVSCDGLLSLSHLIWMAVCAK